MKTGQFLLKAIPVCPPCDRSAIRHDLELEWDYQQTVVRQFPPSFWSSVFVI
jgi:hypothetical protein